MGWSGSSEQTKKSYSKAAKKPAKYGVPAQNTNAMEHNDISAWLAVKAKTTKTSPNSTGSLLHNTTTVQSYEPKTFDELYNVRVNAQFVMEEEDMDDVFGENRFRNFYNREEIDAEAMNTAVTITNYKNIYRTNNSIWIL